MSSTGGADSVADRSREENSSATLLDISLPRGTPLEAEVAIRRLIELTQALARRAAQLQEALESRIVIEQAKGVLAERYGVSVDEAFVLLRGAARFNRLKLHSLAAEVVSSPTTPEAFARVNGNGRLDALSEGLRSVRREA
jgi:ANTAR domain